MPGKKTDDSFVSLSLGGDRWLAISTKSRNVYEGKFQGIGEFDDRAFVVLQELEGDDKSEKIVFFDSIEAIEIGKAD